MRIVIPKKYHEYKSPEPKCSTCGRDDEPLVAFCAYKTDAYLCKHCVDEIQRTFSDDGTPRCSYCKKPKPQAELSPIDDFLDPNKTHMCQDCLRVGIDTLKKLNEKEKAGG